MMSEVKILLITVISLILVLIGIRSCKPAQKKYSIVITEAGKDISGRTEIIDKKETILENNDSLAYSNGCRTFLAHKLTNILLGLDTNIYKPLFFTVLNERDEDISLSLHIKTIMSVNATWAEIYHKQMSETLAKRARIKIKR